MLIFLQIAWLGKPCILAVTSRPRCYTLERKLKSNESSIASVSLARSDRPSEVVNNSKSNIFLISILQVCSVVLLASKAGSFSVRLAISRVALCVTRVEQYNTHGQKVRRNANTQIRTCAAWVSNAVHTDACLTNTTSFLGTNDTCALSVSRRSAAKQKLNVRLCCRRR